MLLENIHGVIRRIDYTLTDADIDIWAQQCILAVENETFDFSTKVKEVFTQSGKRRVIYHYPKLSVENFICHYLKKRLDKVFKIEYASRSKIINLLFNTIPALKNMNDFVIIRADFKSFFDSVLSRFVYEKYVLPSLLPRGDKDILEKYIDEYKYCYAGLCLSNGMTEIVCRDFDKKLKARLTSYGVFFYERYVDDMLFTTKEEQKAYVEREMQMENDNVRPYLLKSHVIRYGSKSKQSIMNQLNEIVCKYETKDRTLIAYFLSAILNHVGKNKDKVRIFKKDVSESTVFSFLDLVFYAYSFFPNYNNTQKLLSIISYVRDEYDIFSKSRSLQNLLNKYAFVFEKANLNDIVDLFLFCAQAEIEIPYVEEERIVKKLYEKDDPILWATYLLYSKYNEKYYNDIKTTIEQILAKRIEAIRVQKSIFEYREFWWVLVFNKCPLLSSTSQILINGVINSLPYTGTGNRNCADIALDVFVDYLKNNGEQFFEWDMSRKDFLRTITFKTHEKSIFKNYKESVASLVWGSI